MYAITIFALSDLDLKPANPKPGTNYGFDDLLRSTLKNSQKWWAFLDRPKFLKCVGSIASTKWGRVDLSCRIFLGFAVQKRVMG